MNKASLPLITILYQKSLIPTVGPFHWFRVTTDGVSYTTEHSCPYTCSGCVIQSPSNSTLVTEVTNRIGYGYYFGGY